MAKEGLLAICLKLEKKHIDFLESCEKQVERFKRQSKAKIWAPHTCKAWKNGLKLWIRYVCFMMPMPHNFVNWHVFWNANASQLGKDVETRVSWMLYYICSTKQQNHISRHTRKLHSWYMIHARAKYLFTVNTIVSKCLNMHLPQCETRYQGTSKGTRQICMHFLPWTRLSVWVLHFDPMLFVLPHSSLFVGRTPYQRVNLHLLQ